MTPHGPTIAEVEAVVRSVLTALRPVLASGHGPTGVPTVSPVFAGRLVGERDAAAMVAAGAPVRITPGTVVTPLARDILKRAGIELRFASQAELTASGLTGEWGFAFEPAGGQVDPLRRSLLADSAIWSDLGADPLQAAAWVVAGAGRGAVVLTESAARIAWSANQTAGVRAATAVDPAGVVRAIEQLGLNLLVVEPAGRSIFELRHLCAVFRRGGAPRPPAWLADGVGSVSHADRRDHRSGYGLQGPSQPPERPVPDRVTDAAGRPRGEFARAW